MTSTVIKMSIQRMICTNCGAEANASCNCGEAYLPKSIRAAEAIKANPTKSDRALAAEIGVHHSTVNEARKQLSDHPTVERTGLDGKTRRMPRHEDIADDEVDVEHLQSALVIHAGTALDLAEMLHATFEGNPVSLTGEAVATIRRTANAWNALADKLEKVHHAE